MDDHTHQHSYQCQSRRCCELSELSLDHKHSGTRFRLFPQTPLLKGFKTPETVWVSFPPESIGPGPSDHRMYVVDAINKAHYELPNMPPYQGDFHLPAVAASDGHFDHLKIGTHQFESAHIYGTLRFVMDIWECYLGHQIEWSFAQHFEKLEIIPWLDWNNAHCGYGYIEAGYRKDDDGRKFPLNLNFDVLAHEFGHAILYSELGMPRDKTASTSYFAYHEAASDMVAVISVLHFDSVVDRLLSDTKGNLYVRNELNRVGEESDTRQIRMASNALKLSDAPDPATPRSQLSYKEIHAISLPITGALFDLLMEIYQHNLVYAGLIDSELDALSRGIVEDDLALESQIQNKFEMAYEGQHDGFKKALIDARDHIGMLLGLSWFQLDAHLDFTQAVYSLLQAEQTLSAGHYANEIKETFERREIPT